MLRVFARLGRSRLRAFLVVFFVPVVVLATPGTASAATSGTMTFGLSGEGLESSIPTVGNTTCQLPWSVNVGGMIIGSSARCDGGPDYSPGHCQPFEGACGSYALVIKDSTGATMGSTSFDPFDIGGGIGSVKAGLGGGYVSLGSGVPAEACLSHQFTPAFGGSTDVSSCVAISVDLPDDTPDEIPGCVHGFPTVRYEYREAPATQGPSYVRRQWWAVYDVSGMPAVSTAQLSVYTKWDNGGGQFNITANGLQHKLTDTLGLVTSGPAPRATVYGTQFYFYPDPWNQTFPDNSAPVIPNATQIANPGRQVPYFGMTSPEHCRFYYGPKAFDDPNSDRDDPVADPGVPTPPYVPEVPPTTVEPIDDTPDTDSGMWAAILAVLRAIGAAIGNVLSAVKGLAVAIVNGIRSMLSGLFLPADGFMEAKWDGVDSKWQGTSPGRYMSALDDFSPGTVSGCSGLPLNVDLGHGIAVNEHIGAACSGSMASAASVTRVVIMAVFSVAGAVACVRAVGAGLGWDPGIGRGGAA